MENVRCASTGIASTRYLYPYLPALPSHPPEPAQAWRLACSMADTERAGWECHGLMGGPARLGSRAIIHGDSAAATSSQRGPVARRCAKHCKGGKRNTHLTPHPGPPSRPLWRWDIDTQTREACNMLPVTSRCCFRVLQQLYPPRAPCHGHPLSAWAAERKGGGGSMSQNHHGCRCPLLLLGCHTGCPGTPPSAQMPTAGSLLRPTQITSTWCHGAGSLFGRTTMPRRDLQPPSLVALVVEVVRTKCTGCCGVVEAARLTMHVEHLLLN